MKRILSKYWLVLFIAVLIAWPAVVISMQRVDPPDEATLNKLESLLTEKLQLSNKTIAPPPPELDTQKRDIYSREVQPFIYDLLPIAAGDTLKDKLRQAEEIYSPFIQYYDSQTSGTISQDWKFMERQTAAKIHRASAQRAILTENWDEALRRLYSTANIGNSCREQSLIGMLIAVATRAIAYGAYEQLLHAEAPTEVKRAALEQLKSLRETDAFLTKNTALNETLHSLKSRREMLENPEAAKKRLGENQGGAVAPIYPTQMLVMGVVSQLTVLEDENYTRQWSQLLGPPKEIKIDPALKRWISKRAKNSQQYAIYKWTDIPAAERWLKKIVKQEPWIYKTHGFEEEIYKQLDPWTLALFSNLNYLGANLEEAQTRARIGATKGRLLEAAFAAQIYQSEMGKMPDWKTINETLHPLPETTYGPIQIARRNSTAVLNTFLWSSLLPSLKGAWLHPIGDFATDQWSATFDGPISEARQKAAEALALKQILNQYPKLVESVSLFQTDPQNSLARREIRSVDDIKDAQSTTSPGSTAPVVPTPKPMPTPNPTPGSYGGYGYGGYGGGTPQPQVPMVNLQFFATLRAPDRVWILWSPGPDGVDDGGTIQYDPTNGTTSRGDLIVFPEVF